MSMQYCSQGVTFVSGYCIIPKPGFTLEAAVVETPGGPYFVKVVGPAHTLDRWSTSIRDFLQSTRYE